MNIAKWKNYSVFVRRRKSVAAMDCRGKVVDLGCGTAQYKDIILETAEKYVGVDWQNSLHDQSNVDVFANISESVPLPDGEADTVVAFEVMEHLREPQVFLKEAYRILRAGGRFHMTVPFMWHIHEAPNDFYRYTRFGLDYLLTKTGFTDVLVEENGGFWWATALKLNYRSARLPLGPLKAMLVPFWWFNQTVGAWLDRVDPQPEETGGYIVHAMKPASTH